MSKDISLDRSIISCFPYDKYGIREAQRKVLEGIDMAIQAGKNYIIIQAPTGVGKSAISYALLRYFEEGYVCTGTKALQDQYLGDFETLLTVKGRNNFFLPAKDGWGFLRERSLRSYETELRQETFIETVRLACLFFSQR
jgi:ATP-dependent DNA helicase DinG